MAKALDDLRAGIRINEVTIYNIRYADDTVLLADNLKDLQTMLDAVAFHSSSRMGLRLNPKKRKEWSSGSQDMVAALASVLVAVF